MNKKYYEMTIIENGKENKMRIPADSFKVEPCYHIDDDGNHQIVALAVVHTPKF